MANFDAYDPTRYYSIKDSDTGKNTPSDFKLMYWKTGAEIPENILDKVHQKFENALSLTDISEKNKLRMCCYEFCYLILFKSGLLMEDQINDIIHISANSMARLPEDNPRGKRVYMPEAFMDGDWSNVNSLVDDNLPLPDDIILVKSIIGKIQHVALSLGGHKFYELNDGVLGEKDLLKNKFESKFESVYLKYYYWVSLKDVQNNVTKFIELNRELLPIPSKVKFSEKEFKRQLENSRYSKLI